MSDLEPGVQLSPDAIAAMERLSTSPPPPRNTMSEQRAPSSAWADALRTVRSSPAGVAACLLELRARVEALEATQHAHVDTSHLSKEWRDQILQDLAKPARVFAAGSLVERVGAAIGSAPTMELEDEARAAILEVAAWFRTERDSPETAAVLEQEANR